MAAYLQANGWPAAGVGALTDTNLQNGQVQFEGTTKMRVLTPRQETSFFFGPTAAALLGGSSADGVDIGARAAVEIRSGLGVLPFVVGATVSPGPDKCLTDPPPGAGTECVADSGNFGSAKVGRSGLPTADWLPANMKFGLDHNPEAFEAPSDPLTGLPLTPTDPNRPDLPSTFPLGGICKTSPTTVPTGALLDASPWDSVFNCLETDTGLVSPLVDGLVTYDKTSAPCDGRIGGGVPGGDRVENCYLTANKWLQHRPSATGPVDVAILDDPRFGFVPRVWKVFNDGVPAPGGAKAYAIIGFYGAYVTDMYIKDGSGVLLCRENACNQPSKKPVLLKANLFDLGDLSEDVYPNAGPTGDYIGYGPKKSRSSSSSGQ